MKKLVLIITTLSLISFSCLPVTTSTSMSLVDKIEEFIDGYSDLNEAQKEALRGSSIQGSIHLKSSSSSSNVNLNSSNTTTMSLASLDEFYSITLNSNLDTPLELNIKFISSSGQILLEGKQELNLKEEEDNNNSNNDNDDNLKTEETIEFDSSNPFIVEETEFFSNLEDNGDSSSSTDTNSSKQCPSNFNYVKTDFFDYCKGSDENKFLKFNTKANCHDNSNKDTTNIDLTFSTITQTSKCTGGVCQPITLDQLSGLSHLTNTIDIVLKTKDNTQIFCAVGTSEQNTIGIGTDYGF